MLLTELLQRAKGSSSVLFHDPFATVGRDQLVREVIALANADLDGPRYIVFGVNPGAMQGNGFVGIDQDLLRDLKRAHRLVSVLVKPMVALAFVFDRVEGKLIGALEVDGCDAAPYVVRQDAEGLVTGQSWIAKGRVLRALSSAELQGIKVRAMQKQTWEVKVGLNGRPDCQYLALELPERSNPPSAREKRSVKRTFDWKKAAKNAIGTVNTSILRLMHVRDYGPGAEFDERGLDTLIDVYKEVGRKLTEADDYYFFEERALKINLSLCNAGNEPLKGVSVELVLPRVADFGVPDHIYKDPSDNQVHGNLEAGRYPDVRAYEDAFVVRAIIGNLLPDQSRQAFDCALRLAAGPKMEGKRVAMHYVLRARNRTNPCRGRLKIEFKRAAQAIELSLEPDKSESADPYNTAASWHR